MSSTNTQGYTGNFVGKENKYHRNGPAENKNRGRLLLIKNGFIQTYYKTNTARKIFASVAVRSKKLKIAAWHKAYNAFIAKLLKLFFYWGLCNSDLMLHAYSKYLEIKSK